MKKVLLLFLLMNVFLITGCQNDRTPEKLCKVLVECDAYGDMETCLGFTGSLVLSDDCIDEMMDASCEDHNSIAPSYWDTCFEGCFTPSRECKKDTLVICDGRTRYVVDCERVCRYQTGGSYQGDCGTVSSSGEVSSIGPVCWCLIQ